VSFDSLLNNTCIIQERTKTQDSLTGDMIESWVNVYTNVKCRLNRNTGSEYIAQETKIASNDYTLFIAMGFMINTGEHRVIVDNKIYNITDINNAGGQSHHFELRLQIKE